MDQEEKALIPKNKCKSGQDAEKLQGQCCLSKADGEMGQAGTMNEGIKLCQRAKQPQQAST